MRGIVIAGTHSGCGKTTVTLGILAALKKKGLVVQPFKAGPDFIDAGLHGTVTGRPSRNLDQWMCGQDYVLDCFMRHASDADIAVIEGVMGMHDGDSSTASLARLLQAPVILVVDAYGMAESAGAVVKGFSEFGMRNAECGVKGKNPKFAGVIFNRVASENHYKRLKESVINVPVLGYLPRDLNFVIPHRHLGLMIAEENPIAFASLDKLADAVMTHIDIDTLYKSGNRGIDEKHPHQDICFRIPHSAFRIAVAYDKAFSFYYEDNLDLLSDAGAKIIRFSPLRDEAIPDNADVVYIGGGYPELHAGVLSRNTSMLGAIRAWADAGRPLYAECGGLMYLSRGVHDFDGNFFAMAGVFPFETRMTRKPRLGYREIVLNEDCIVGNKGEKCRGHEFHYSEIKDRDREPGAGSQEAGRKIRTEIYCVKDNQGRSIQQTEGFRWKNTLASYVHVHFGGNRHVAERFAAFVKKERIA